MNPNNEPVQPVLQYLKFKDNSGAARNTLRSFCFHLKLFFEYLEQVQKDYREIGLDELAEFMRWLQNPYKHAKVSPIQSNEPIRTLDELVQSLPVNKQEFLTGKEAKQQYGLKADLP
ncbi:hypothetical protein [Paenibacillus sp. Soil766]|uniref:hypothetical protein n=1 Tax=Paenibacillus sp. Soil766 TaxID=1736404 RepID=UPI001F4929FF|nr:hypothetical protein [Paenibacillus sp. Soil766]